MAEIKSNLPFYLSCASIVSNENSIKINFWEFALLLYVPADLISYAKWNPNM